MGERGSSILRNLDRFLGIPFTYPAALYRKFAAPAQLSKMEFPQKICVLCLGAIGDLLLVSALIQGLRAKNPSARIELVTSRANSGAIPLIPNVDASFSFSVKRPDIVIRHARKMRYDLLFDCSQWARIGNIISNFSGAGATVGFKTPGQHRAAGYTRTAPHSPAKHETDNFLALGRAVWPGFTGKPSLSIPENTGKNTRQISKKTIFCHMWPASGKGRHLKMWPENHWAELIEILLGRGFNVALTGGRENRAETDNFRQKYFNGADEVKTLAGQASLLELAAHFTRAKALVSVNTGIMHLAALLGAPTVGLHGATNPLRWGPVGPACASLLPRAGQFAYLNLGFEYPPHAQNSMGSLPVADVLDALGSLKAI